MQIQKHCKASITTECSFNSELPRDTKNDKPLSNYYMANTLMIIIIEPITACEQQKQL